MSMNAKFIFPTSSSSSSARTNRASTAYVPSLSSAAPSYAGATATPSAAGPRTRTSSGLRTRLSSLTNAFSSSSAASTTASAHVAPSHASSHTHLLAHGANTHTSGAPHRNSNGPGSGNSDTSSAGLHSRLLSLSFDPLGPCTPDWEKGGRSSSGTSSAARSSLAAGALQTFGESLHTVSISRSSSSASLSTAAPRSVSRVPSSASLSGHGNMNFKAPSRRGSIRLSSSASTQSLLSVRRE